MGIQISRNPQDGSQHEHRLRGDAGSLHFLEQRVSFGMTDRDECRHDHVARRTRKGQMRQIHGWIARGWGRTAAVRGESE
jgi:hypothetical protein